MDEIVNKVANSPLVTLDLGDYVDKEPVRKGIDIADQLFEGLILREKDFRQYIKTTDWSQFKGSYVHIYCSSDAIIPHWAFMLLTTALQPYAKRIVFGSEEDLNLEIFRSAFDLEDIEKYSDKKMVIKGCGDFKVPASIFVYVTEKLAPIASSIMYGEPCSTVPVYKRKKS